jgi:FkbM family methyltransferase
MPPLRSAIHNATELLGLRLTRTGFGALGWLVERSPLAAEVLGRPHIFVPDDAHRFRWLQKFELRSVLDIGAHQGEFARRIHEILPDANVVSFEPLPECYRELERAGNGSSWHRAFNLALGSSRGTTTMNQNEFTPASSLLPISEGMRRELPFAVESRSVTVEVETLDTVCAGLHLEDNVMVKIDVQGYEGEVIAGGRQVLRRAKLVVVETSFQRLYADQPLFDTIYRELTALGLRYVGSWDRQPSPIDGFALQEDSIFVRD